MSIVIIHSTASLCIRTVVPHSCASFNMQACRLGGAICTHSNLSICMLYGVGMQVCVVFTIIAGFMFVLYKCVHVVSDRADC